MQVSIPEPPYCARVAVAFLTSACKIFLKRTEQKTGESRAPVATNGVYRYSRRVGGSIKSEVSQIRGSLQEVSTRGQSFAHLLGVLGLLLELFEDRPGLLVVRDPVVVINRDLTPRVGLRRNRTVSPCSWTRSPGERAGVRIGVVAGDGRAVIELRCAPSHCRTGTSTATRTRA